MVICIDRPKSRPAILAGAMLTSTLIFAFGASGPVHASGLFGDPAEPEVVYDEPAIHSCEKDVNPDLAAGRGRLVYTGRHGQPICMSPLHYEQYHKPRENNRIPVRAEVEIRPRTPTPGCPEVDSAAGFLGQLGAMVVGRVTGCNEAPRGVRRKAERPAGYDMSHTPREKVFYRCLSANLGPGEVLYRDQNGDAYCMTDQEAAQFDS